MKMGLKMAFTGSVEHETVAVECENALQRPCAVRREYLWSVLLHNWTALDWTILTVSHFRTKYENIAHAVR